jgi:hypothetical protein
VPQLSRNRASTKGLMELCFDSINLFNSSTSLPMSEATNEKIISANNRTASGSSTNLNAAKYFCRNEAD